MDIKYSYKECPIVKQFSESDKFIRGLMGPVGSGKSTGCVIEIIKRAHEQEPGPDGVRRTRWVVIRNTYQQLRDTTVKTFHEWLPPEHFGEWRKSEYTYNITAFDNCEIEVLFRALDRPDQVANILSMEVTGAWINEAREVPQTIVQAVGTRVGRYPAVKTVKPTWFGVFMDTNPPDQDSWWYKYFEEKRPGKAEIFKQPSGLSENAENINNLPPGYYQNLIDTMEKDAADVYVRAKYGFVKDGKPVYNEYNDNIHCSDTATVTQGLVIQRGWDFGLTPSCTFSQITPSGKWVIFDEMISESIGADRFSDDVLQHSSEEYPGYEFEDVGDPAGQQRAQSDETTCFKILQGKGIKITGGEQDPTIRLESVRKPLTTLISGQPMFQIHPRCKTLRKGFQGLYKYRRIQVADEKYADKPDKNDYSHPHDALQYTATRLFADMVRNKKKPTPKPIRKVSNAWM